MESERIPDPEDMDFTDAELEMVADYTDALLARKNPDMEEFLKRCPRSEAKMRPLLEVTLLLDREITQFRRKYPHVDLGRLLDLQRESGSKPK